MGSVATCSSRKPGATLKVFMDSSGDNGGAGGTMIREKISCAFSHCAQPVSSEGGRARGRSAGMDWPCRDSKQARLASNRAATRMDLIVGLLATTDATDAPRRDRPSAMPSAVPCPYQMASRYWDFDRNEGSCCWRFQRGCGVRV